MSDEGNWQREVRRLFSGAIEVYDRRGLMIPPEGASGIKAMLEPLSSEPLPTPSDVNLVCQVARRFGVHPEIRRRIADDPRFRDGLAWSVRDGELKLWRSFRAPLWAAEVILHFERQDWDQGIPEPLHIRFRRHDDVNDPHAMPVYRIGDFKGLEADFVLLFIESSALIPSSELHEIYVGTSRARLLLAVVVDERARGRLCPRHFQDSGDGASGSMRGRPINLHRSSIAPGLMD